MVGSSRRFTSVRHDADLDREKTRDIESGERNETGFVFTRQDEDHNMLKITVQKDPRAGSASVLLEGRLVGAWVDELERSWKELGAGMHSCTVDLTAITYIDPKGKALLTEMWRAGAKLLATGCCNKSIIEGIKQADAMSTEKHRSCT